MVMEEKDSICFAVSGSSHISQLSGLLFDFPMLEPKAKPTQGLEEVASSQMAPQLFGAGRWFHTGVEGTALGEVSWQVQACSRWRSQVPKSQVGWCGRFKGR